MTISSSSRKAGPTAGNGVTDTIPFTFKVFTEADLVVVALDTSTSVETTLVLTTDYTVTLNANQNVDPGGDIVIVDPAADWATGTSIIVTSDVDETQGADITNRGGFYASIITTALDKLTILVQQLAEKVTRSLKMPITTASSFDATLPAPVADHVILINSTGDGFTSALTSAGIDLATMTSLTYDPATSGLSAVNGQTAIDELDATIDKINTLSGVAKDAVDLGTFTGTTIADNSVIKVALQAIETAFELVSTKVTNLITLSGVAANATSLGTFTGTTIADNQTVKAALQALETSVETKLTGSAIGAPAAQSTLTPGTVKTFAHGLSSTPTFFSFYLTCTSDELGYTAGDVVPIAHVTSPNGIYSSGFTPWADATNVYVQLAVDYITIARRNAVGPDVIGLAKLIDPTKWTLGVRCFA